MFSCKAKVCLPLPHQVTRECRHSFFSSYSSSIVVIDYIHKDAIIKKEELPIYTALSFISDVGGILGLFLGLSFWSAYDFVEMLIDMVNSLVELKNLNMGNRLEAERKRASEKKNVGQRVKETRLAYSQGWQGELIHLKKAGLNWMD